MDPPPLLLPIATNPTPTYSNYPDSVESSPLSHPADLFNETLPLPGAKLRLMCSYGGHIIPRPHDKTLCYVGGETRMVVIDRHSSLSNLSSRLSRTLLNGRLFTLKYQLPHEDLDSLVSVTTDEDLDNMVEEYDRITASTTSGLSRSRIRLFLFFDKPETVASMGSLLDDAKSETWFVDVLNGSVLLPRNLSDSATMDRLLNLDSDHDLEAQVEGGSSDRLNRISSSDDERSDQGVPISCRKPPQHVAQPVHHKASTCYNLPSPDSVARDNRARASPDTEFPSSQIQMQQVQDSGYTSPPHLDQQQQQYVRASTHYIPHPTRTAVPMSSYYPLNPPPSQQPHHPIDHQYPVYVMTVTQTLPYMSMQSNMVDTTSVVPSSRPVAPQTSAVVAPTCL